ncbi:MAG TPA: Crp/Fnr family transcriptional regulator [Chloroflexi bacterium]|nr:MAG: hypothetical protein B6I38_11340 [Anaerolineaceae bacterium 4572_5.1]HEY85693.1 Crp/Fnr family transcriptional regulator [Chloroflexota bacterium]
MKTEPESLKELLAKTHPFTALNKTERAEFAQNAISRRYKKGEFCAYQEDVWPYLCLVGNGKINIVKESQEGRSLIVQTLEAGDIFWGLAFFQDNASMPVSLQASQSSRLYLWHRESVQPILLKNSRALWELCQLMVVRMERASEIVEDLAFYPVAGRLARFLLEHFEEASSDAPVARDVTLDEMAARIGSTREMVCRALYRFADEKMIQINRTEFVFTSREKLEELAGES